MKTLLSRKSILSILMVLAILSSGVFSFYAVDSYSLYMSQERPLTKTSPTSYNSDWLEEPFVMREGLLDDYQSFYEDAQISVGNVYQERLVNGELELVCLATGNFENYNHSGNDMYLSVGGTISHLDLTTLEMSVIYTGDTAVANLWVFDGIIFFQVADSIYHYYCPTETLRLLATVEDIRAWKPMSNYVIRIIEDNSLYYEAVAASGVSENEQPTDVAAFSAWLNQNLSLETSPESKVLQQCDVQNILSASGVSSVNCYWYNAVTNQVLSEYTEPEQPVQAQTFQLTRSSTATARSSAIVRSVIPTVWAYQTGDHFSDDKEEGCVRCHGTDGGGQACNRIVESGCDCKIFDQAIQCDGYAKYLYNMTSTYMVPSVNNNSNDVDITIHVGSNSSDAWNFFSELNFPLYFCGVSEYSGQNHSVLIYAATSSSIGICEANTSNYLPEGENHLCRVVNRQMLSYAEFLGRFTSIVRIVEPPTQHVHSQSVYYYNYDHRLECTSCRTPLSSLHGTDVSYYDMSEYAHVLLCGICDTTLSAAEPHYFDEDGYCICGYSQFWRRINRQTLELQ